MTCGTTSRRELLRLILNLRPVSDVIDTVVLDDHRHSDHHVKVGFLFPFTVFAEMIPMVTGVEEEGVVSDAQRVERVHEANHQVIDRAQHRPAGAHGVSGTPWIVVRRCRIEKL